MAGALIALMTEEKSHYLELLDKAAEKQDVLTRNDVESLGRIVEIEERAVAALVELDKKKTDVLTGLGRLYGMQEPPVLSDVISHTKDPQEKQQLAALQEEFQRIVYELAMQNELNQRLIETQLQYTSFCINLMTQDAHVGDFYGNTGQVNEEQSTIRRGLMHRKV